MAKAGTTTEKTVPMQWIAKKHNHEWITVVIASVLGFGAVIALITFAELAQIAHR